MAKITVYLTSGQTITFDGTYEPVRSPISKELMKHGFRTTVHSGFKIEFLGRDVVTAGTSQEDQE